MAVRSFGAVVGKDGPHPFVDVPAAVSRAFAAFAESGRIRVRIHALGELDGAVRRWIDRAYRVGCREHLRRGPEQ